MSDDKKLVRFSKGMRRDIVELTYRAGNEGSHMGGSLSLVEILTVLFDEFIKYDPRNPRWNGRDRVVLSKAHTSLALYAAMHQAGCYSEDDMQMSIYGDDTFLYKHCKRDLNWGIEMTGGSLGQGLPFALGISIALQWRNNRKSNVYVILGDGECDEGSVWEAASLAGHKHQNNLTVIIDMNGLQLDGPTCEIMNMDNMADRWAAFGFDTIEIDGHDYNQIRHAFAMGSNRPKAIIAHTVKGKGLSFAENDPKWHNSIITDELYKQALEEIGD